MAVTLKHIAEEAGVSISTASRVLRGVGRVNAETGDRVRGVANQLGYWKSKSLAFHATGYRNPADHTLRIMLARASSRRESLLQEFDDRFERIVKEQLQAVNARLEVQPLDDAESFERVMQKFRPHGVILQSLVPRNWLNQLRKRVAVVGTADQAWQHGVDTIDLNEQRAAADIVQCLHDLGHRFFAFTSVIDVGHPSLATPRGMGEIEPWHLASMTADAPRHAAWSVYNVRDTAPMVANVVLVKRDWHFRSLDQAMDDTIDRVFAIRPRPTAIVVGADVCAVALIERLRERGVRVPEDVGIIGYGGRRAVTDHPPHLTTLRLPVAQMAQLSPELIQRRLADPEALPLSLRLDGEIVMRRTLLPLDQMESTVSIPIDPAAAAQPRFNPERRP